MQPAEVLSHDRVVTAMQRAFDWQPGPRPRHVDDHCIAQTYARIYLLERATAEPAMKRGWAGLNWALQPSGKLGWVQQIGYDPRSVTADDSMEYGTGAFLLAGSEVLRFIDQSSASRPRSTCGGRGRQPGALRPTPTTSGAIC